MWVLFPQGEEDNFRQEFILEFSTLTIFKYILEVNCDNEKYQKSRLLIEIEEEIGLLQSNRN